MPAEVVSVLAALLVFALVPLDVWETRTTAALLRANLKDTPPETTLVVYLDAERARGEHCAHALATLAERAQTHGLLLLYPVNVLCGRAAERDEGALVFEGEQPIAFAGPTRFPSALLKLGPFIPDAFLVGFQPRAVPSVALTDLLAGSVPWTVGHGRIAVVALTGDRREHAAWIASAFAAGLEHGQRFRVPAWGSALLGVLLCGLVALGRRRHFWLTIPLAAGFSLLLVPLSWLLVRYFETSLLPLVHLWVALWLAVGLVWLPRLWAGRKALRYAEDLVERAALMRSEGIHLLGDDEFWPRLGDLASQAHPADTVLVAELPPRQWHLRFWPYRGQGENMVAERRRDIRRTPYSNEQGVPTIGVTHRYLVTEGVPTVVVPLIALGEVEGYVFLVGDKALRAHLEAPDLARQLSQDLGLLIRRRRRGGTGHAGFRSIAQRSSWDASATTAKLVEGAEVAVGDLKMFGSLVRNAPVGLLYADAFGHVRIVSRNVVEWLTRLGISVPAQGQDGPLSPGALQLGTILSALSQTQGQEVSLASLSGESGERTFRTPMEASGERDKVVYRFSLKALHEQSEGLTWVAGYVGALVEDPSGGHDGEGSVIPFRPATVTEGLSVQPLAQIAKAAVRTAMARAGKTVRFEPPRDLAHAIAYHDALQEALADLLAESAQRDPSDKGPTLVLSEGANQVELTVLDLHFGLPLSALKRVLLAPSDPPLGLEMFGRFVRAVVESHGSVLLNEDEWGLSVVAKLLRARPFTRVPSLQPPAPRQARKTR